MPVMLVFTWMSKLYCIHDAALDTHVFQMSIHFSVRKCIPSVNDKTQFTSIHRTCSRACVSKSEISRHYRHSYLQLVVCSAQRRTVSTQVQYAISLITNWACQPESTKQLKLPRLGRVHWFLGFGSHNKMDQSLRLYPKSII